MRIIYIFFKYLTEEQIDDKVDSGYNSYHHNNQIVDVSEPILDLVNSPCLSQSHGSPLVLVSAKLLWNKV